MFDLGRVKLIVNAFISIVSMHAQKRSDATIHILSKIIDSFILLKSWPVHNSISIFKLVFSQSFEISVEKKIFQYP